MKLLRTRRVTALVSALVIGGASLTAAALGAASFHGGSKPASGVTLTLPRHLPVLNNDGAGGCVTFTFDDGPGPVTPLLLRELRAEHVPAVFFVIGEKAQAGPATIRAEVADGFTVGDHTWDHRSFTGLSTKTRPLTDAQVRTELSRGAGAIVAAGAPRPVLWRAPYDDVSQHQAGIASSLGLKLVMSYGTPPQNIVDSKDWDATTPQQIAAYVEQGSVWSSVTGKTTVATPAEAAHAEAAHAADPGTAADPGGYPTGNGGTYSHGITGGSVLGFHDGTPDAALTVQAIPLIVAYLNAHHLCATTTIPAGDIGLPAGGSTGGGG